MKYVYLMTHPYQRWYASLTPPTAPVFIFVPSPPMARNLPVIYESFCCEGMWWCHFQKSLMYSSMELYDQDTEKFVSWTKLHAPLWLFWHNTFCYHFSPVLSFDPKVRTSKYNEAQLRFFSFFTCLSLNYSAIDVNLKTKLFPDCYN